MTTRAVILKHIVAGVLFLGSISVSATEQQAPLMTDKGFFADVRVGAIQWLSFSGFSAETVAVSENSLPAFVPTYGIAVGYMPKCFYGSDATFSVEVEYFRAQFFMIDESRAAGDLGKGYHLDFGKVGFRAAEDFDRVTAYLDAGIGAFLPSIGKAGPFGEIGGGAAYNFTAALAAKLTYESVLLVNRGSGSSNSMKNASLGNMFILSFQYIL